MVIMMILASVISTSCDCFLIDESDGAEGIRAGFEILNNCIDSTSFLIACESDTKEFDINNVQLIFYYGGLYPSGIESELENARNYPSFEIWLSNNEEKRILVKQMEENLVSEKYSYNVIFNNEYNVTEAAFNHSELITIPSELFTQNSGYVDFTIYSENILEEDSQFELLNYIRFHYERIEDTILLTVIWP